MYIEDTIKHLEQRIEELQSTLTEKTIALESQVSYLASRVNVDSALLINSEAIAIVGNEYLYGGGEMKHLVAIATNDVAANRFISSWGGQSADGKWITTLTKIPLKNYAPLVEDKQE